MAEFHAAQTARADDLHGSNPGLVDKWNEGVADAIDRLAPKAQNWQGRVADVPQEKQDLLTIAGWDASLCFEDRHSPFSKALAPLGRLLSKLLTCQTFRCIGAAHALDQQAGDDAKSANLRAVQKNWTSCTPSSIARQKGPRPGRPRSVSPTR